MKAAYITGSLIIKQSNIEPGIRGSIEYYPIIINNARVGLKLFAGGTYLKF